MIFRFNCELLNSAVLICTRKARTESQRSPQHQLQGKEVQAVPHSWLLSLWQPMPVPSHEELLPLSPGDSGLQDPGQDEGEPRRDLRPHDQLHREADSSSRCFFFNYRRKEAGLFFLQLQSHHQPHVPEDPQLRGSWPQAREEIRGQRLYILFILIRNQPKH
jgi:hypothetical protein